MGAETNPDEAADDRRSTMRVTLTLSCWNGRHAARRLPLPARLAGARSRRIAC